MKRRLKTNKGITLIALVITIIVLLILAGVSIAMLTGDNGIIKQAQNASEQTQIAQEKEQIVLAYNGAVLENSGGDVTAEDLNDQFKSNGAEATAEGESPITVTFTESQRQYEIDEDGVISGPIEEGGGSTEEPTNENIEIDMKIVGEKSTEEPPIPDTGDPSNVFTHVEGTVDDGYVIQDTNGNQFVWVPVDKNQKIKINVTSKEDIESITLTDPYGDNILTVNNADVETTYNNKEVTPTINGPYILKVTTASEEKSFMLGVHSLYAVDTENDWCTNDEYAKAQGYDNFEQLLEDWGYTTEEEFLMDGSFMKDFSETENYTESVNDNGGFYIGRYEASYDNGKVASKKSTIANTSSTLENGKLWNLINQEDSLSYANNMYESEEFTSSLLTGAAWDRTLGWLEETGAVTPYEIVGDSKTWGNYKDDEFSGTTSIANTGEFKETQKNHIYDLAGNVREWTTEAYSAFRVSRGGDYSFGGSDDPSSGRYSYSSDSSYSSIGFRPALYL